MGVADARMESLLGQAIGPEFDYYLEILREKPILIKLGGAVIQEELDTVSDAVLMMTDVGIYPTIVHGAGPQINKKLERNGIPTVKHDGIRVTDDRTLDVVGTVLADVNENICLSLDERGVKTRQFTYQVFTADYKDREKYQNVGDEPTVHTKGILKTLKRGIVPVVSCLGRHPEGGLLNINGDTASSALAAKLMVHKFVTLGDQGGVLDKNGRIIPVLNVREGTIDELIANGTITEGMIPKVQNLADAVALLPPDASAVITNPRSLMRELFTHEGEGTLVREGDEIIRYPSVNAVNHHQVRQLIEEGFSHGKLRKDYFDTLPDNAEVFTTAQAYKGIAIVIPQTGPDEQTAPAYLDKLVTRPALQGYGIGREVIDAAIAHYKGGLYWRTKTTNTQQIEWYEQIAQTRTQVNGWTVFMAGVPEELRAACIKHAINVPETITYKTD